MHAQLPRLTLSDPMDCSPPGSSVHGIFQTRILQWVAISYSMYQYQFSSVQSLSQVQLFVTPRTAAHQAFLSITGSWSLLKLMSIELVMPFNHLILCWPFVYGLAHPIPQILSVLVHLLCSHYIPCSPLLPYLLCLKRFYFVFALVVVQLLSCVWLYGFIKGIIKGLKYCILGLHWWFSD